jgi:hypothetical protein
MIEIAKPVSYIETYRVRPADDFPVGAQGMIVGYGQAITNDTSTSGFHRKGEARVLYKETHVFEFGAPSGACHGDSGGPFLTDYEGYWHVTGVMTAGLYDDCRATEGSVAENAARQIAWIDQTLLELVGYGLDDVPHQGDSSTGADADGDSDGDADGDTGGDTDGDEGAGGDAGQDGEDGGRGGAGCAAAGGMRATGILGLALATLPL